jgi:hypothetical protein
MSHCVCMQRIGVLPPCPIDLTSLYCCGFQPMIAIVDVDYAHLENSGIRRNRLGLVRILAPYCSHSGNMFASLLL